MPRPVRINGFQSPLSGDQKIVMVLYPAVTLIFDGILAWLEHSDWISLLILIVPHLFLVVVTLPNWYLVEVIDPADKTATPGGKQLNPGCKIVCFDQENINSRYCGTCRKQVYGLDHHCTWLNTCIGNRNYVHFFTLVVTGTAQMTYQSSICILYMSVWRQRAGAIPDSGNGLVIFYVLMSFYCLLSISLALAFGVLMSFHLYLLLWVRAGTYDWMMQEREDYNARSRAAKKQYESAHRIKKFDDGRKEGVITATGDIEFAARHHSDSESSINNDDAWSASGEEVESFMSSHTTEELDDPCKEDILEHAVDIPLPGEPVAVGTVISNKSCDGSIEESENI